MTNKEMNEFKKWNVEITKNNEAAREVAREIEEKYFRINGTRSCNPETFVFEIANTQSVAQEERIHDMRNYIDSLKKGAQLDALFGILHIYR